jgi:hypothetical protein
MAIFAGRLASALVGLTWAFTPLVAHAQTDADSWQWRASIYAWLPGISGDTQFPSGEGGPSINVDADKILQTWNSLHGHCSARRLRASSPTA